MGRAAGLAGVVIVALMLAGTIDVKVDDAWLWSLLALFLVTIVAPDPTRRRFRRRGRTDSET